MIPRERDRPAEKRIRTEYEENEEMADKIYIYICNVICTCHDDKKISFIYVVYTDGIRRECRYRGEFLDLIVLIMHEIPLDYDLILDEESGD